MPCGMKYDFMAIEGSTGHAPPDAAMPMRLMDSTPPPMARSFMPVITCAAARFTASRPEAQNRLICTPGTSLPKPAFNAAFLFQAEDGIRDPLVPGVQTCALPI